MGFTSDSSSGAVDLGTKDKDQKITTYALAKSPNINRGVTKTTPPRNARAWLDA